MLSFAIAVRRSLPIVEDACQAIGATISGTSVGSWGDVSVLSFGGSKLLTAGRGGAIMTRREDWYQRAKVYCERGNDAFPLSELQAAVLVPQLDALPVRHRTRLLNAERLFKQIETVSELTPVSGNPPESEPAYYKIGFWWNGPSDGPLSRDSFLKAIQAEGVAMDVGFRGFAQRSTRRCRKVGDLTNSASAADSTIVLHHPVLLGSEESIDRVAAAIRKVADVLRRRAN